MSAKKETFYVSKCVEGWMVRTDGSHPPSGPYTDREAAIASALIWAKENRPSSVRVEHFIGEWRVECTYDDQRNAR